MSRSVQEQFADRDTYKISSLGELRSDTFDNFCISYLKALISKPAGPEARRPYSWRIPR